jgi:D-amino peptidase
MICSNRKVITSKFWRLALTMKAAILAVLVLLISSPLLGQVKKTIFMVTDAEGVAGICRQEQTEPTLSELRELLTGEVNAAVQGFLNGGADEVVVWDGHDGSQTLSAATIHPKAKLLIGWPGVTMTLDRGYSAIAFIGQHSMANVQKGIMAHSFSSLGIQNLLMNGKPVGEIGMVSALAGHFNIPVILLTGDRAAAEEIRGLIPQVETVTVKEGLGRYTCLSLSAATARVQIQEAATRAMAGVGKIPPYKIEGPVTLQVEQTTRNSLAPDTGALPGVQVLDDRTLRIQGKDFMEAWTRWKVYR